MYKERGKFTIQKMTKIVNFIFACSFAVLNYF